ncbi:MAG: hypothetical protein DIU80_023835, partial [Chloroflexota bacterium]
AADDDAGVGACHPWPAARVVLEAYVTGALQAVLRGIISLRNTTGWLERHGAAPVELIRCAALCRRRGFAAPGERDAF